ncbi:unnamed protein product, partial [Heterosigma akashiwo]
MGGGAIFSKDALIHAFAGCAGGMISMSILYPLDQVRSYKQICDSPEMKNMSIVQTLHYILTKEGPEGLYRGILPQVLTIGATNFAYFFSFNFGKLVVLRSRTNRGDMSTSFTVVEYIALSTIAGIITVLVTAPLWVASTRIKMGQHASKRKENNRSAKPQTAGLASKIIEILRKEGLKALWDGTIPSLVLVSNPIIQFVVYEMVKARVLARRLAVGSGQMGLTGTEAFLLGAAAKACATVATYPLQLAQNKLRVKETDNNGKPRHAGTAACLGAVAREGGVRACYRGLDAKLLQTVLAGAFTYLNYEKIVRAVQAAA